MLNILLIDADSKIPNLALMKLSFYYKSRGCKVDLIRLNLSYYPSRNNLHHYIRTSGYDNIFCSVIFDNTKRYIHGDNITFGGTGESLYTELSQIVEQMPPDYTIYPDNQYSYGFISRGCIRKCSFCKVPKKEGSIKQVNNISQIIKHKRVRFLDNNILALENHKEILKQLGDLQIRCTFYQGLDIFLLDRHNSLLLKRLNYDGEYTFAFDNIKYETRIDKKLKLLGWRKPYQIRFFLYVHPKMRLKDTISRITWCKKNKIKPYIMRDISCWYSKYNEFYIDIASYCNQPSLFKNMSFKTFLLKRHSKKKRIKKSLELYEKSLKRKFTICLRKIGGIYIGNKNYI